MVRRWERDWRGRDEEGERLDGAAWGGEGEGMWTVLDGRGERRMRRGIMHRERRSEVGGGGEVV
jgi:hypothetical protein